jgi:ethanolamine utilization protein EutQ (cupin superfamily)
MDMKTPRRVRTFRSDTARDWMEWSGIALADVVNEDEDTGVKLGAVGFTRAPAGSRSDFEFPYDEVMIVTRGRCSVTSNGETHSAGMGEVVYLPAGVAGTFQAHEDVELVYVASSPYGEVNRDIKAELLAKAGAE